MVNQEHVAMSRFPAVAVAVTLALGWASMMTRSHTRRVLAEFPWSTLKWIRVAEPEFERRKLDVDKYTVMVVEGDDSVTVMLRAPGIRKGARGSAGAYPDYEVEISKKDLKIVHSNYVR
jgi:hypothetical protein